LTHQQDGRYSFAIRRVATGELVAVNPTEPLPDREQARALLRDAGQKIFRPPALYAPVAAESLPPIVQTMQRVGLLLIVDNSSSMGPPPQGAGSDPGGRLRIAAADRAIEPLALRVKVGTA